MKTINLCREIASLCIVIVSCLLPMTLQAQSPIVIADSLYNPADWSIAELVTEFGASQETEQLMMGGNPGAFRLMRHILPVPPGLTDLSRVEVTHLYISQIYWARFDGPIDHIDFSEDIRLLGLPWAQAFVTSSLVIRQGLKSYRTSAFLSVVAETTWVTGSLPGLTANDFIALDGSSDKPDFSQGGGFMEFGIWRVHTRGATQPPIPPDQDLIYEHGSDNFTVTIHRTPAANRPPDAKSDSYFYADINFNDLVRYPVLQNDSDPDGDAIRIMSVEQPTFGGNISSFNDSTISYQHDSILQSDMPFDEFKYTITDGQDTSATSVLIRFCTCPIECILAPLISQAVSNDLGVKSLTTQIRQDTLDIDLFRRVRDEVLLPTEKGQGIVNLYYRHAPELLEVIVLDTMQLAERAFNLATLMQTPFRDLIEGNGDALITQSLVDSTGLFRDTLLTSVSDSLRDDLTAVLTGFGLLQDYVGLEIAEAVNKAIGDSAATGVRQSAISGPDRFILHQNYPNPFNPSTTIRYSLAKPEQVTLKVYSLTGQVLVTLVDKRQQAGQHAITWRPKDLASGLYVYRLQIQASVKSKKMILLK